MDNLNIIISILIGVGLFFVYYNIIHNKNNLNLKLTENINKLTSDNNALMKYFKGNVKYDNEDKTKSDIEEEKEGPSNDSTSQIDHTRIFKKIDNSDYKLPVNNKLYNDNNVDPRSGPKCNQVLNCNAKKRYDLLINDDYDSFDVFNTNCSREISSYSQETNNPNIDKMLLVENPQIYENISRQL